MVKRLASEKMSKNLFNQIHHITFILESGKFFEVITDNEVSLDECSMSGVEVYLIKNQYGKKYH